MEEKPGFLKIVFDYPYLISVPDIFFPVRVTPPDHGEELLGLVRAEAREGVQVYDKGKLLRETKKKPKGILEVLKSMLRVSKDTSSIGEIGIVQRDNLDTEVMELVATGQDNNPLFHYVAGRDGRSEYPWHYNQIEVVFPVNNVYAAYTNPTNRDYITDVVVKLFNRMLSHYRNCSNDVHNKMITSEDSLAFYTTVYISEFSEEEKKTNTILLLNPEKISTRSFKPFPMRGKDSKETDVPLVQSSITPPLQNNARKKEMSPGHVEAFIKGTGGMYDVKIFNQILLSGIERIALSRDYKIAITEFDTALEMAVMYYLINFLVLDGKSHEQINNLFDESSETSRNLAKGYLSTNSRIARLNERIGDEVDLFKTTEYKNWNSDVRKKRNKIVHMWEHFEKKDAETAFHSSQAFIRYLQKVIDPILENKKHESN